MSSKKLWLMLTGWNVELKEGTISSPAQLSSRGLGHKDMNLPPSVHLSPSSVYEVLQYPFLHVPAFFIIFCSDCTVKDAVSSSSLLSSFKRVSFAVYLYCFCTFTCYKFSTLKAVLWRPPCINSWIKGLPPPSSSLIGRAQQEALWLAERANVEIRHKVD